MRERREFIERYIDASSDKRDFDADGRLPPQARHARGDQPHGASRSSARRRARAASRSCASVERPMELPADGAPIERSPPDASGPDDRAPTATPPRPRHGAPPTRRRRRRADGAQASDRRRPTDRRPTTGATPVTRPASPRRPQPLLGRDPRCAGLRRSTPEALEQALRSTQREEGGRASARSWCACALIDEEQLACGAGRAARDAGRSRELPSAEDIDADLVERAAHRLRQAAPRAAARRDATTARVQVAIADPLAVDVLDDVAVLLGAPVEPVLAPPAPDPRRHQQGLRAGCAAAPSSSRGQEGRRGRRVRRGRGAGRHPRRQRRGADHPLGQLAAVPARSRSGPRDIHIEPGEKEVVGPLPHRRRAARERKRAPRQFHAVDHRPREDHGRPEHRREAPAAGRPHPPQDRRQGHRHARRHRPDRRRRAHHHPSARPRARCCSTWPTSASATTTCALMRRASSTGRTASCWSPAPPARARRPRSTPACREINTPDLNILTVEDPVEYQLEGISQIAGQPEDRSDLRHRAALASCATTPTSSWSARSATARPPRSPSRPRSPATWCSPPSTPTTPPAPSPAWSTWASSRSWWPRRWSGLLAQRLVRRLCPDCREPYQPTDEELRQLGLDPATFFAGQLRRRVRSRASAPPPPGMLYRARDGGCASCLSAGYRGRTGIYELLMVDDDDPPAGAQERRRRRRSRRRRIAERHAHPARRRRAQGPGRHDHAPRRS